MWRECSAGCDDAPGPRGMIVRVVGAPESAAPGMLGCSVVDVQQGAGTLATLYADRIESLANRTRVDPGTLLGRAVAHEIGHLLLGTSSHSRAGLMRAGWSDREIQRDVTADWTWSPGDVIAVHRGAVLRERRLRPTTVMAGAIRP